MNEDFVSMSAWVKKTTRETLRAEAVRRRRTGDAVQMADIAGMILDTAVEGGDYGAEPVEEKG